MCEFDVPAMIHVSGSCNPALHATGSFHIAADTIAFMQFIEGDLFARVPNLRFIIPHGGGVVRWMPGIDTPPFWRGAPGQQGLIDRSQICRFMLPSARTWACPKRSNARSPPIPISRSPPTVSMKAAYARARRSTVQSRLKVRRMEPTHDRA